MPDVKEKGPRFFGRRRGRTLRTAPRRLLEELLPRLVIEVPDSGTSISLAALFEAKRRAFWLEVGFGGGEHLAWQAEHNPDIGIIGAEVFLNGIASLLGHVAHRGLANVRVFPEDVRGLLPALPDGGFERVFVLFPDPWPKKRHAERRFIGGPNLDQIARLLNDGGVLRIATDDATYKAWAVDQMAKRPEFEYLASPRNPEDWPATRYETKAIKAGRVPLFLEYRRLPRGAAS